MKMKHCFIAALAFATPSNAQADTNLTCTRGIQGAPPIEGVVNIENPSLSFDGIDYDIVQLDETFLAGTSVSRDGLLISNVLINRQSGEFAWSMVARCLFGCDLSSVEAMSLTGTCDRDRF
jgi:hypothetical protein